MDTVLLFMTKKKKAKKGKKDKKRALYPPFSHYLFILNPSFLSTPKFHVLVYL